MTKRQKFSDKEMPPYEPMSLLENRLMEASRSSQVKVQLFAADVSTIHAAAIASKKEDIVAKCREIFMANLPSLRAETGLKEILSRLVDNYYSSHTDLLNSSTEDIANEIFEEQILSFWLEGELISNVKIPASKLPTSEEIEEQKSLARSPDVSYGSEIPIRKGSVHTISLVKYLIFFDSESSFVKILSEDFNLQKFVTEYRDDLKRTLLHYSIACNNSAVFETILKLPEGRALLGEKDVLGRTLMHTAAQVGNVDFIKKLHDLDSYLIKAKDTYERTPLHLAALFNKNEAAETLLDLGADYNAMDNAPYCRTPLYLAVKSDSYSAVKVFYDKCGGIEQFSQECDKNGNTLVHIAIIRDSVNILEFLFSLDDKLDFNSANKHHNTLLHQAAFYGRPNIADLLLKRGADFKRLDDNKLYPLFTTMGGSESWAKDKSWIDRKILTATTFLSWNCCFLIDENYTEIYGEQLKSLDSWVQKCNSNPKVSDKYSILPEVKEYFNKMIHFFEPHFRQELRLKVIQKEDYVPILVEVARAKRDEWLKDFIGDLPKFGAILSDCALGVLLNTVSAHAEQVMLLIRSGILSKDFICSNIDYFEDALSLFVKDQQKFLEEQTRIIGDTEKVYSLLLGSAISTLHKEAIKLILQQGYNNILLHRDPEGYTPLLRAILSKDQSVLQLIEEEYIRQRKVQGQLLDDDEAANIRATLGLMKINEDEGTEKVDYIVQKVLKPLFLDVDSKVCNFVYSFGNVVDTDTLGNLPMEC